MDLTNYDVTILFEISQVGPDGIFPPTRITDAVADNCQNLMGMSVVESDYDRLKRYNLAEIYDPSPKKAEKTDSSGAQAKS